MERMSLPLTVPMGNKDRHGVVQIMQRNNLQNSIHFCVKVRKLYNNQRQNSDIMAKIVLYYAEYVGVSPYSCGEKVHGEWWKSEWLLSRKTLILEVG